MLIKRPKFDQALPLSLSLALMVDVKFEDPSLSLLLTPDNNFISSRVKQRFLPRSSFLSASDCSLGRSVYLLNLNHFMLVTSESTCVKYL
jgi:hypothetical protein